MKKLTNPPSMVLLSGSDGSSASPDFITVSDWANRLQVSKRSIFRMIDERIIPPYDFAVGKTRRWHFSTYERWVASNIGGK
jgi:excisionase family DNA binding protein